MSVQIQKSNHSLLIKVAFPRLDGENHIINALDDDECFQPDVESIEIDLSSVDYINSLGISEFVTINRRFLEVRPNGVNFRLTNVDRRVNAILELVEFEKVAEIALKVDA